MNKFDDCFVNKTSELETHLINILAEILSRLRVTIAQMKYDCSSFNLFLFIGKFEESKNIIT